MRECITVGDVFNYINVYVEETLIRETGSERILFDGKTDEIPLKHAGRIIRFIDIFKGKLVLTVGGYR